MIEGVFLGCGKCVRDGRTPCSRTSGSSRLSWTGRARGATLSLFFCLFLFHFARSAAACLTLTPSIIAVLCRTCRALHPSASRLAVVCRVVRRAAPIDAYQVRQITAAATLHLLFGGWAGGVTLLVKFMHGQRGALTVDTVNRAILGPRDRHVCCIGY